MALTDRRGSGIPVATFDPDGLYRAILNVVTNAIDACAEAIEQAEAESLAVDETPPAAGDLGAPAPTRHVAVQTAFDKDNSKLLVRIRDNAAGIPADQVKRIFNVFVSSKGHRGTGMGLPVSQKILEEHGGQILVESRPGEGSCFTLEWPAHLVEVTGPLELERGGPQHQE